MINIDKKHNCCGCSACVQSCPKQCISLHEDKEGFLYPEVDNDSCIDCGLCEKVCPYFNQSEFRKPLKVYAVVNPIEEIRMQSSSGGIFTMLAETIIDEGGVVFGARFDKNWEVVHDYTETKDGLEAFRGSKYVQSHIGQTYIQARDFLKAGRKILFSGTSCQIAGLKCFLRKEYENLLTVDVVCHGVPSPLVWREYLKELTERPKGVVGKNTVLSSQKEKPVITGISFRDKSTGWKKFGFVVRGKSAFKADQNSVLQSVTDNEQESELVHDFAWNNTYLRTFLLNYNLRPSCFNCPSKHGKSNSDFSIADYWGAYKYAPEMDDNKGITLALCYTDRAVKFMDRISCKKELSYSQALTGNSVIERPVAYNNRRDEFWKAYLSGGLASISDFITPKKTTFFQKVCNKIVYELSKLCNK